MTAATAGTSDPTFDAYRARLEAGERVPYNFAPSAADGMAELYFPDLYWPDFDRGALKQALAWFGARQRRMGR